MLQSRNVNFGFKSIFIQIPTGPLLYQFFLEGAHILGWLVLADPSLTGKHTFIQAIRPFAVGRYPMIVSNLEQEFARMTNASFAQSDLVQF
jgi:hypothetical protein